MKGSDGAVPPEGNPGWSGRHPAESGRASPLRAGSRIPHGDPGRAQAAVLRRVDMFEPLADTEKKSSGRTMKVIGVVIVVAAIALAIISFA